MAATKITSLTPISTIDTAVDPLPIVDVSDTSQSASGTTKKVTVDQIESSIFGATGSKAIVVDNVAALKALTVASVDDGQLFLTRGYYTENDGGQGSYIYDSTSAAADNGGTVLAPTSGTGRYLLQYSGSINVKQFGAKGDGVTSDTVAIQNAINCGEKKIIIPIGSYITGSLTLQNWTHLIGATMPVTVGGGDGPVRLVFNLSSGTAITCGFNPVIENITFKNTAGTYNESTATLSGTTAIGILTVDNATISNCNFYFWYECINLSGSPYYFKSYNVEFARCTYGYRSTTVSAYDVNISAPISRLTNVFISGTSTYPIRNIKVFGGSIEGYSNVAQYFLDASFFGTYFETISQKAGAFAIDPLVNAASVSLFGCLVYLNYTSRFVNLSGLSNAMLCSSGNVFEGTAPASSYIFYFPSTGTINLSGDRFGTAHPNDLRYVDSLNFSDALNIVFPKLPSANVLFAYSSLTFFSKRGFVMSALASEPSTKVSGMMVLADGSTWDPLTRAYGRPYWVAWQGDRWRTPGGLT